MDFFHEEIRVDPCRSKIGSSMFFHLKSKWRGSGLIHRTLGCWLLLLHPLSGDSFGVAIAVRRYKHEYLPSKHGSNHWRSGSDAAKTGRNSVGPVQFLVLSAAFSTFQLLPLSPMTFNCILAHISSVDSKTPTTKCTSMFWKEKSNSKKNTDLTKPWRKLAHGREL